VEVALWPAAALGALWSEVLGVVVALGVAAFWSVVLGVVALGELGVVL
jgi:hypothetical protein